MDGTLSISTTTNRSDHPMATASPRPVILSTQMLQDQILRCCCDPAPAAITPAALPAPAQTEPAPPAAPAVLNIWQRMSPIERTRGGVEIVVTVINSGAQTAEDVVLTATLTPVLAKTRYRLKAGPGWLAATLAKLESAPVALAPGRAQTFSWAITPVRKSAAVSLTSTASAVAADPAVSSAAGTLTVSIGG
jgi:hypothetical protein